ncbi:DoxX family membrane protein [Candidatus Woesearchaeota archaeon]|nr:DoxX family membrane protein [Candidatus Woesearchaeota archaeon]
MRKLLEKNRNKIFRIFLGFVFLSAGLYRVFFYDHALMEVHSLGLPDFFTFIIIGIEVIGGAMLIIDYKTKFFLELITLFLCIAIMLALISNWQTLLTQLPMLFIFNDEITDIMLHITYILLLVTLFRQIK